MKLNKRIENKENLNKAFEECRESHKTGSFFVAFFDGNGLKAVNDTYGHLVGDAVIQRISNVMVDNIRAKDRIIRFGGDEFVLILGNFIKSDIKNFIGRIQDSVRTDKTLIQLTGGLSISVGVVEYDPAKHHNLNEVIHEADILMYSSKKRPPKYSAYSGDAIEDLKQFEKRPKDKRAKRGRKFFSWVTLILIEENPTWNLDELTILTRKFFRKKNFKITDEFSIEKTLSELESIYKVNKKVA